MFEPKFLKQRPVLPPEAHQALAALIHSKLSIDVNWNGDRGDFLSKGEVFCSITPEGALALKLPAARTEELIGKGQAKPWTVGNSTLENWVVISATGVSAEVLRWIQEARDYVSSSARKDRDEPHNPAGE